MKKKNSFFLRTQRSDLLISLRKVVKYRYLNKSLIKGKTVTVNPISCTTLSKSVYYGNVIVIRLSLNKKQE